MAAIELRENWRLTRARGLVASDGAHGAHGANS